MRTYRKLRWALVLASMLGVLASSAGAARADDVAQAKELNKKAQTAYALGQYGEAAKLYEGAFAAKAHPALLYNAAQAHRLAGGRDKALTLYQNYLRLYPKAPNRGEVEGHIAALQKAIADKAAAAAPPVRDPVAEAQRCFDPARKADAEGAAGGVVVRVVIGPAGEVEGATVHLSSFEQEEVGDCLVDVLRGWRFPPPFGGTVVVNYPFVLRGRGEAQVARARIIGAAKPAVSGALFSRLADLKTCFPPSDEGALDTALVRLKVDPKGRVVRDQVSVSPTGDPKIARCVEQLVYEWRFPAVAGADATVEFFFQPARF